MGVDGLPYGLLVIAGIVAALNPSSDLIPGRCRSWRVFWCRRFWLASCWHSSKIGACWRLSPNKLRDPLTGVANRALLDYRLEQAMRRHAEGVSVGVASLDVDDFKLLNDTLGHPAGIRCSSTSPVDFWGVDEGDTVAAWAAMNS